MPLVSLIFLTLFNFVMAQDKIGQIITPFISDEIDTLIISKENKIIFEHTAKNYDKTKRHRSWSMAKTFMVVLAGVMEKDGLVHREESLGECLADDKFKAIKLKHLMQMTSGIDFLEKYETNPLTSHVVEMLFLPSGYTDMAAFMRTQAIKHRPGEVFNYSSGDSVLLMSCLQKKLAGNVKQYFDQKIFTPLGITSVILEYDQKGLWVSASYLYATAEDYLKFAQFLLNPNPAIIDPNFVKWMTEINISQKNADHTPQRPYGAGLWLFQAPESLDLKIHSKNSDLKDAYMARGHNGQAIAIVPTHSLVVIKLASERFPDSYLPKMIEAIIEKGIQ